MCLGKQGIAFRGKIEDITSTKNLGNFLALLKSYAETKSILFNHLYHTKAKFARHLSHTTQNEIINIIGMIKFLLLLSRKQSKLIIFLSLLMNFHVIIWNTYSYASVLLTVLVISEKIFYHLLSWNEFKLSSKCYNSILGRDWFVTQLFVWSGV